jgi:hypothetical protein
MSCTAAPTKPMVGRDRLTALQSVAQVLNIERIMSPTRGPGKNIVPNSRSISKKGTMGNIAGVIVRNSGILCILLKVS